MKEVAQNLRNIIKQIVPQLKAISNDDASIKPRPEKWSKKEIIGHLIDSASNNQQKFVRIMQQPHLDFVGYQQDFWVASQKYNQVDWLVVVGLWSFYNYHIAHIIESVDPSVLDNTISISGSQPFTLRFIMTDYAEHLKHHLKQILPKAGLESQFENVYNA